MKPARRLWTIAGAVAAAAWLGAVVGPRVGLARNQPGPARHLLPPEHIAPAAQTEVRARMGRHDETMSNLTHAVILLDRPTIRVLAGRIADEEVIARTGRSVHDPLSASLPREFFLQQTKLVVAARDLAVAAEGGDDLVLADRFARVTHTCVGCHSAYLHGEADSGPSGAPH